MTEARAISHFSSSYMSVHLIDLDEASAFAEGEDEVDEMGVGVGDGFVGGGVAAEGLEGAVLFEELGHVVDVVEISGLHAPGGVEFFGLGFGEAVEFYAAGRYWSPGTTRMVHLYKRANRKWRPGRR